MESLNLKGIRGEQQTIVAQKDTAIAYNSGTLEVFATPAMIALMEKTAMLSIVDKLPDTSTTVGTAVNIEHLKATAVGKHVRCESEIIESEGRRLVFSVKVFENKTLIGSGTHERFIVDIQKFMLKI
ncbi:MAG: thioesterase family protein [Lentimicrobiaceae bacterium]|jgi:predicted thioesterase|nr:thioesterase family protein [Lentimicrobiaceae bacterium]